MVQTGKPMMRPLLSDKATQLRIKIILPYVRGRVLDVGCGWARIPGLLAPEQRYVGVDGNAEALAFDRGKYPQHRFLLRDVDRQPLDLGEERFDTVVMTAVIEHLHVPQHILDEIHSVLAPGGVLLITTPTPFGDWLHRIGDPLKLFYSEAVVAHVQIFDRQALHRIVAERRYDAVHYQSFAWGANQLLVCRPR
jgi:SAM-dependent methyltransferase